MFGAAGLSLHRIITHARGGDRSSEFLGARSRWSAAVRRERPCGLPSRAAASRAAAELPRSAVPRTADKRRGRTAAALPLCPRTACSASTIPHLHRPTAPTSDGGAGRGPRQLAFGRRGVALSRNCAFARPWRVLRAGRFMSGPRAGRRAGVQGRGCLSAAISDSRWLSDRASSATAPPDGTARAVRRSRTPGIEPRSAIPQRPS